MNPLRAEMGDAAMTPTSESIETLGWPLAFALRSDRIPPPTWTLQTEDGTRRVRVLGRALAGMQKHALVDTGEGGRPPGPFSATKAPISTARTSRPFHSPSLPPAARSASPGR